MPDAEGATPLDLTGARSGAVELFAAATATEEARSRLGRRRGGPKSFRFKLLLQGCPYTVENNLNRLVFITLPYCVIHWL